MSLFTGRALICMQGRMKSTKHRSIFFPGSGRSAKVRLSFCPPRSRECIVGSVEQAEITLVFTREHPPFFLGLVFRSSVLSLNFRSRKNDVCAHAHMWRKPHQEDELHVHVLVVVSMNWWVTVLVLRHGLSFSGFVRAMKNLFVVLTVESRLTVWGRWNPIEPSANYGKNILLK